jgi:heme-degrading monooxygenase HmoA
MAVLMTQDLQGANREVVEAVSDDLGVFDNPPAGLIAHVLTETDGGIRAVDIWESEAHFQAFAKERLMPSARKILQERGMSMDGFSDPTFVEVFDFFVRGS